MISTLSFTKVQYEKPFSKQKVIKTRLRNLFSEENLELYMLLSIEKELLDEVDAETISGRFEQSSSEHERLLLIYCAVCDILQ